MLLARAERAAGGGRRSRRRRTAFAQELANDPTNANAAYELAEMHRKNGELDQARTWFETALAHYPDFEEALVGLGRTLIVLEQPALAIARLRGRAIALNPKSEVAYYQFAQAHRALGDAAAQEKALATFEQLRSAAGANGAAVPGPSRGHEAEARSGLPGKSLR